MKLTRIPAQLKRGFTLIELMVVIAILAALASVGYPTILEQMNSGARQTATSNLTEIKNMLFQFKKDYGSYPCDATAEELMEKNPEINYGELSGNYANDYFRQFFYQTANNTEKTFHVEIACAGKKTHEGDNSFANGRALERGENGFAYVMQKDSDNLESKKAITASNAPIAMTSVYPAKDPYSGESFDIDAASFRAHFFVLSGDGSVKDWSKNVIEDEGDPEKGQLDKSISIFPELKRSGKPTADRYWILTPEL